MCLRFVSDILGKRRKYSNRHVRLFVDRQSQKGILSRICAGARPWDGVCVS